MSNSNLLLENGSNTLLEDGSSKLELESSFPPIPSVTTPDFPGQTAQRCVALLLTAMVAPVFPPPPPANPSTNAACWQPEYADFARAAQRPVNEGGAFNPPFPTPPDYVASHLTWQAKYPDFPEQAAPRATSLRLDALIKPPSQFGRAVRFSGANQNNGLILTSQLFGPTNFTVGGWFFNPTLPGAGATPALWSLQDNIDDSTAPVHFIDVQLEHDGTIDVNTSGTEVAFGTVKVGRWSYALLSVTTGGAATAYFGDTSKPTLTSTPITGLDSTFTPLSFSLDTSNFATDFPFNGRLWGWRVWSTALTAGEAAAEFSSFYTSKVANSLAQWQLDHTATKFVDSSGNGRTLAAEGAGTWIEEEGPFLFPLDAGDPHIGRFPFERQPDPLRLIPPTAALYDSGGGCDFVFTPTSGFDPSSNPSWLPEFPESVTSLKELADEQLTLAFVPLVTAVFDPSKAPSWLPSFPDFVRGSVPLVREGWFALTIEEREPQLDWLSSWADFPGRASPRAVGEGGYAPFDNFDFIPKLSWAPSFPDFPARALPRAVNEGGVFRAHLEYEPTDWFPQYEDFARASQRATSLREQFTFLDPDFVPKLAWAPSFPDFARASARAVNEGTVFRTHLEYEPTDWFPSYDDFARAPQRATSLREQFAYVNPDFVPKLSWAPTYPDFVRGAAKLVAEGRFTLIIEEYEPTDWFPSYPDTVPGPLRALELREGGASYVDTYVAPTLGWQPEYPDFPGRAALRPVNEGGLFRTHVEYEPTDWFPYYQDTVPGPTRALELREGGASFVDPDFVPKLAWSPSFPDFARSAQRPVAEGSAVVVIQEREPQLDWLSEYPDFARAAPRAVNEGGTFRTHLEYEPTDWFPSYPDFAYAAQRSLSLRQGYAFLDPDFIPKLSWGPSYPDFARGQTPRVSEGFFTLNIQEREPQLDWLSEWPDFARGPLPLVNIGLVSFFDSREPLDPSKSPAWLPDFPDFARSAPRAVNEGTVFRTHIEYEPTDWFPSYPDFAYAALRSIDLRDGYAFIDLDYTPRLAWAPSFPDFAKGHQPLVATGDFELVQIVRTVLLTDWLPEFPDFARSPQRAVNEGGLFRTHVEYEPTDWFPYYQDSVPAAPRALELREGGAVFVDLDVAPKLSWSPSFSDFPGRSVLRPVNEGGVFRTHVEYEPSTDWISKYPDILPGRRLPAPVIEGGQFFENFDFTPRLSWAPSFPDFAGRAALRPVNEGGTFRTHVEYEPTDWFPSFDDFARSPARSIELSSRFAFTDPDFVPKLAWLPVFPDFARARQPLVNTGTSVIVIEEHEPKLDWLSEYPDFVRAPARPVNVGGQPFLLTSTVFNPANSPSWLPDFPDFARAPRRAVNEGTVFRTHLEYEPTDWFPDYPDFARGRAPLVATGFFSLNIQEREPQLDWLSEWPDFARAAPRAVNEGGVFRAHVEYEPTDWFPTYPDFATSAPRSIDLRETYVFLDPDFIPKLAWAPSYPDFARETARPVNEGTVFRTHLEYEPTDWFPAYPDFAYAAQRSIELLENYAFIDHEASKTLPLDWLPVFPDFIWKTPLTAMGWVATVFEKVAAVSSLGWLPEFPDAVAGRPRRDLEQRVMPLPVIPAVVPKLSWSPTFPDSVNSTSALPRLPGFSTPAFKTDLNVNEVGTLEGDALLYGRLDVLNLEAQRALDFPAVQIFESLRSRPAPVTQRKSVPASVVKERVRVPSTAAAPDFTPRLSWAPTFPDFARGRTVVCIGESFFFDFSG